MQHLPQNRGTTQRTTQRTERRAELANNNKRDKTETKNNKKK